MSRTTRIALTVLGGFAVVAAGLVAALLLTHRLFAETTSGTEVRSTAQLEGTFVSDSSASTPPVPLVPASPVRLVFSDGRIGVSAGCNRMGGSVSVAGGHLVVGRLVSTQIACQPDTLMEQEQWVRRMLEARPAADLGGDRLTLSWSGSTLVLDRAQAGAPTVTSTVTTPAPSTTAPVPGGLGRSFATPPPTLMTRPTVGPGAVGTGSPGPDPSFNTLPETPQGPST